MMTKAEEGNDRHICESSSSGGRRVVLRIFCNPKYNNAANKAQARSACGQQGRKNRQIDVVGGPQRDLRQQQASRCYRYPWTPSYVPSDERQIQDSPSTLAHTGKS